MVTLGNNEIYCMDCLEGMQLMEDESVNIVITSPPYWNQKSYAFWLKYEYYLDSVQKWLVEIYRLLEAGRHCFWVIPDKLPFPPAVSGEKERNYLPIYGDTEAIASSVGFVCEFPIIWKKPHGSQKMFGSFPYPPTTIHTPMTERICVWRKPGSYRKRDKSTKESSRYGKEDWVSCAQDLWEINPETNVDHPAPFPIEIPRRILKLWSFMGDVVLDPFIGSGTTALAARNLARSYIGFESKGEYVEIANLRLAQLELYWPGVS